MKIEPNAEQRAAAIACNQMFIALKDEGFTEQQALTIIGQMIRANTK